MRETLKQWILPLTSIDRALPKSGVIYDLGCGEGIVASYLAAKRHKRKVFGIDQDTHKLYQARAGTPTNLHFIRANLLTYRFPHKADGFILADVLHHIPASKQVNLLRRLSKYLKPTGVLVIKEINAADVVRSKLSRLWDFILYPQDKINYVTKYELISTLTRCGLKVTHQQTNLFAPASVHLYTAKK